MKNFKRIQMGICPDNVMCYDKDDFAKIEQTLADAKAERDEWRNVIATICADGGHYHLEHGTKATAEHCIQQVLQDRNALREAKAEIERLCAAIATPEVYAGVVREVEEKDFAAQIERLKEEYVSVKSHYEGEFGRLNMELRQARDIANSRQTEIEQLKAEVAEWKRPPVCLWCRRVLPDDKMEDRNVLAAALHEHLMSCPDHPMRIVEARVAELEGLLCRSGCYLSTVSDTQVTGLKKDIERVLNPQPSPAAKPSQPCSLCQGTGIMPGEHDVSALYEDPEKEKPHEP